MLNEHYICWLANIPSKWCMIPVKNASYNRQKIKQYTWHINSETSPKIYVDEWPWKFKYNEAE